MECKLGSVGDNFGSFLCSPTVPEPRGAEPEGTGWPEPDPDPDPDPEGPLSFSPAPPAPAPIPAPRRTTLASTPEHHPDSISSISSSLSTSKLTKTFLFFTFIIPYFLKSLNI